MNRIKNSGECCKSELDLFYTVPTNTSHWIAIYFFKNKKAIFFDSYGQSAKLYKLDKFLRKNSVSFIENTQILQGNSPYCGYYCVFLLYLCL